MSNPASRLLKLVIQLSERPNHENLATSFKLLFDLPDADQYELRARIASLLSTCHKEIISISEKFNILPSHELGLDQTIDNLKMIFDVNNIGKQKDEIGSYLGVITKLGLAYLSSQYSEEDVEFSSEALEEIASLIDQLKTSIDSDEIDPLLKSILSRHVDDLDNALENYKILGSDVFFKTFQESILEFPLEQEVFESNAGKKESKIYGEIIKSIISAIDEAPKYKDKIDKLKGVVESTTGLCKAVGLDKLLLN